MSDNQSDRSKELSVEFVCFVFNAWKTLENMELDTCRTENNQETLTNFLPAAGFDPGLETEV